MNAKIFSLIMEMSDATKQENQAIGHLSQVMNHLIKIKYAESNQYVSDWIKDINRNLIQAKHDCSRKNSVLSKLHKSETMQKVYRKAMTAYQKDYRTDKYMANPSKIPIPQNCPWAVDELFNDSIEKLLLKLPESKY